MKRGFCPQCGALNAGFQTYCLICKTPLPTIRSPEQKRAEGPFPPGGAASSGPNSCSHCGAKLRPNVKFCTQCGALVGSTVTSASTAAPLGKVCLRCNAKLSPNAKFCKECGASVA